MDDKVNRQNDLNDNKVSRGIDNRTNLSAFQTMVKYSRYLYLKDQKNSQNQKKNESVGKKLVISYVGTDIKQIIDEVEKLDLKALTEDKDVKMINHVGADEVSFNNKEIRENKKVSFAYVEYTLQKGQVLSGFLSRLFTNEFNLPEKEGSYPVGATDVKFNGEKFVFKKYNSKDTDVSFYFKCWLVFQSFKLYSKDNLFDLFSVQELYNVFGDNLYEFVRSCYGMKYGKQIDEKQIKSYLKEEVNKCVCFYIDFYLILASVIFPWIALLSCAISVWIGLAVLIMGLPCGYLVGKCIGNREYKQILSYVYTLEHNNFDCKTLPKDLEERQKNTLRCFEEEYFNYNSKIFDSTNRDSIIPDQSKNNNSKNEMIK